VTHKPRGACGISSNHLKTGFAYAHVVTESESPGSAGDEVPSPGGRIHLSAPDVGQLEEAFVLDAMRSGWVAPAGPHLAAFETALAERCGRSYAVALSSGTAALHLALLGLGVGPGSVVVVPTLTFVATANAVLYTGASPVFVDCDEGTGNLSPEVLAATLKAHESEGTPVSAVICVDILGKCADYTSISEVCASYGVPILEDAAESLGASVSGRPAGSFGVAAILSFNGNKILTTSGGGALLTDDKPTADHARYLSTQARQPVTHYEHLDMGFNYRMSNVLAAIGRAQLQRLDSMIARRRELRERYSKMFDYIPGVCVFQRDGDRDDNCWLTALLIDPDEAGFDAEALAIALAADDIETRPLWKPMHAQPMFAGARSYLTGAADRLFSRGVTLPSGSGIGSAEMARIEDAIKAFLVHHG